MIQKLGQCKVGCWQRDGFDKEVKLAQGGSVTNGATLSSFTRPGVARGSSTKSLVTELDGVGPVDNRPSTA